MARRDLRVKYPWNEWLDGQEHTHHVPYDTSLRSFIAYLYAYAKRNGMYVRARRDEAEYSVTFQFFDSADQYAHTRHPERSRSSAGTFDPGYDLPYDNPLAPHCAVCGRALSSATIAHGSSVCGAGSGESWHATCQKDSPAEDTRRKCQECFSLFEPDPLLPSSPLCTVCNENAFNGN